MGMKLMQYYDQAEKLGGMKAKMRLAMITCIGSVVAPNQPDSPENIMKFEKALMEIKKEYA